MSAGVAEHSTRSSNARECVAVVRDPSAPHFAEEPTDRAQRVPRPTLAAKGVWTDEHAAIVHGERRDVVEEGARLAVLKEILLDVGRVKSAHDGTPALEVGPDGANCLGTREVSADR